MTARTVLTIAALTLQEAARRRVLRALGVLTVTLLGLSAWGFSRLAATEFEGGALTSGEARLTASIVLNLVISFSFPGIDWRAHVGGLISGIVAGAAADGFGDRSSRTATFVATVGALAVFAIGLVVWRTGQLQTQFGL